MATTLAPSEVTEWAKRMVNYRSMDRDRLERIYQYMRDPDLILGKRTTAAGVVDGPLRWLKADVPDDVKRLAEMSRVNMLKYVVDASVQVMFVDGYRAPEEDDDAPSWETWQRNRMDARQIGVHRSALSYGVSYVTVLPGTPKPVIRGASPRKMTAVFQDDEEYPELAIERRPNADKDTKLYRLYDADKAWWIELGPKGDYVIRGSETHGMGVCPVVRFVATINDDGYIMGDVEPFIPIQDQINVTTFGLLVSQHYGAFRQRYIMGWVADSEEQALTASARKLWAFEDPEVKVGEFQQNDLNGYIMSRDSSMRHLASVSQTPAHELLGQLANLSTDALVAAEASHRRKVAEREASFGESWEQVLELAAEAGGDTVDPLAEVRWRDTEARNIATAADALGKMNQMLGVPQQELWEMIPGVTRSQVERWKKTADELRIIDPMSQLAQQLAQPQPAQQPAAQTAAPKA